MKALCVIAPIFLRYRCDIAYRELAHQLNCRIRNVADPRFSSQVRHLWTTSQKFSSSVHALLLLMSKVLCRVETARRVHHRMPRLRCRHRCRTSLEIRSWSQTSLEICLADRRRNPQLSTFDHASFAVNALLVCITNVLAHSMWRAETS